jgi:signal transduction histidine kinase
VRQEENHLDRVAPGRVALFDALRIEQFLDLQRDLLLAGRDADTLPDRLVQWLALFLGVQGAAVGAIEDESYRILATYGVGRDYVLRWNGTRLRDAELAPALTGSRPLVLNDTDGDTPVRTLVLPFNTGEVRGAVHLILSDRGALPDEELQLARALSGLAGVALSNARQCRRLSRLARLKGDALAAMAHDLRAPLNALVGYASLLGEGAFGPLTSEQRDVSATLERQAVELVDLLGATLDVARLENGRLPLRLEEFSVADVLDALAAGTFARARAEGRLVCRVAPDVPPLHSDRVKVKEIVQNLVDNALKHAPGAPVDIDATFLPDQATIRITVRDPGPGIPPDVVPHLFEAFRPGSERTGGSGFGLYLVRCFAEALGGRATAVSGTGGTAISVDLPRVAPGTSDR